jgi:4-amino-4-deoxy-L-arabinose transferase-like glycosyltransferase
MRVSVSKLEATEGLRRPGVGRRVASRARAGLSSIAVATVALRRLPTAAKVCALLAFLNAVCWAQITPPFLGPDEADHFAYVQELVEGHQLPSSALEVYSPMQAQILNDLRYPQVRYRPGHYPISSTAEQEKLEHDLASPLSLRGPGTAGVATSEPPLYYALETIPYVAGSSGSILDRLELMRLLSALLGGLSALFAFLFLREALPAKRWAWTIGGLGVALSPMLGFDTGTVNPDALLIVVATALFYGLARAFRRGLTQRSALAIGALIAIGLLSKLNFVGLVPGAILGLIVLTRREARAHGARAYARLLTPALAIAVSPAVLYALVNAFSNHRALGIVSGAASGLTSVHRSISGELSYIWQLYLPRLPGMHAYFSEVFITYQVWFRDVIGLYGWSDTVFPAWVYGLAVIPAALILVLCVRELALGRVRLRERIGELATYVVMSLGILALVGADGYLSLPVKSAEYADPRYLLPMIALWGGVLALAARGAGRRWGPPVGALLVVLLLAHDIFSQLQTIARYYG